MSIDTLKTAYPIWTIKNRAAVAKLLPTIEGDVQIQGFASVKVPSAIMHCMPDTTTFAMVSPGISALIEHGIIKETVTVKPDKQLDTVKSTSAEK